MHTKPVLPAFCVAGLCLWAATAVTAQKAEPPKDPGARVPVYVTAVESGPSEFMQPGTDTREIADSVKDVQEAFTAGKPKWVRLTTDPVAAVIVVRVTRRTYDDGPEIMSVYTDVMVGAYTFSITGAGDPWRNAARSVVRQLDQWAGVNYEKLRARVPNAQPE